MSTGAVRLRLAAMLLAVACGGGGASPPADLAAQQPPSGAPAAVADTVALLPARVLDAVSEEPRTGLAVLVAGERIAGVVPVERLPAGVRRIELPGRTLLPGFIDAHVHLTSLLEGDWPNRSVRWSTARSALFGVRAAREMLDAGFTTVRNVGGGGFADVALKQAIAAGEVEGPRLLVAGHSIGATGGHCDVTGFRPEVGALFETPERGNADGPDEARAAARYQLKYGADLIKICATGGVLSEGDEVGVQQMTEEELRAVVEVARMAGKKVAAHAHGNEGIRAAVQAGVASIEHGSILDEETLAMMEERGTFLVPTLLAAKGVEELADADQLPDWAAEKTRQIVPRMRESFRLAAGSDVRIALGTDVGVVRHRRAAEEFVLMIEGGLEPIRALRAGTIEAARLLGMEDEVGSIEPGKLADLVALPGDPLEDPRAFLEVDFVMKGGRVLRSPPPLATTAAPAGSPAR